jgi:hypothetical protein
VLKACDRTPNALRCAIEEGMTICSLEASVESEDTTIAEARVENVLYNGQTRWSKDKGTVDSDLALSERKNIAFGGKAL